MNFMQSLSEAQTEILNAEKKGLISRDIYNMVSEKIIELMQLWFYNFNYDLKEEEINDKLIIFENSIKKDLTNLKEERR